MARYRKIDVRIWGDAKFQALSGLEPSGKALWLYLLTSPNTNSIPGLFRCGEAAMAEELEWPLKAFREAFGEVFREGLAEADWKARVIWIPNALKYNRPESPNVVASWAVSWDEIPECRLKHIANKALEDFTEGLGEAFAKAFAKACPKPSGKAMPNQEQEQEQDKEQEPRIPTLVGSAEPTGPSRSEVDWRIERVWEAHVKQWRGFFQEDSGIRPSKEPTLTKEIRDAIRLAMREHDSAYMTPETREDFMRHSKAKAAGIGIFFDPFLTGRHKDNNVLDGGKRYLEHWRPWKPQRGKGSPVDKFAELYFQVKDAHAQS